MHSIRFGAALILALLMLGGCEQAERTEPSAQNVEEAAPVTPEPVPEAEVAEVPDIDTNRFILAANLYERMQSDERLYVFDVRAQTSFDKSHIRGALHMPFGKVDAADVGALAGMTPETPIVTYCGCPHHLSGLAADQLTEWGYRNVRVLYEGFWHWRDHQYPLAALDNPPARELAFAGRITEDGQPMAEVDVFIRNARNGQLEAAGTDANGRFQTGFHVYDSRADDRFEVLIGSLEAPVVARLTTQQGIDGGVIRISAVSGS